MSSINENVKYLLCAMDVFTKYAWVKHLADKKGKTDLNAFIEIGNESNCKQNKQENDKCFNNRSYVLLLLMCIFLKHLRLIPNISKWQDWKIFTKLVPSQNPSWDIQNLIITSLWLWWRYRFLYNNIINC